MPARLYYDDVYTREFSARVVERLTVNERPALVLDGTYFYPTSGGQPNDLGTINDIPVVDVFTREGDAVIVHVLAAPLTDDEVMGRIDWTRRFDHMQHHTGQHILSQAFVQVANAQTVGFHLSADSVTIDLGKTALDANMVIQVEDLANRIIYENHPVTAKLVKPDDAEGVRMRKLPEHLVTNGLRVIDIVGFDTTACGGTHVAHTGEIGIIKILRLEKRGDKTRVEFRCGSRALNDYRLKNTLVYGLTSALTCGMDELPQMVGRLQEQLKAAQSELKSTRQQLVDYEAAQMLAEVSLENSVRIIRRAFADRDAGDIRLLATRLTQTPGVVALLGASGERANLVFARSSDVSHDMNALLKQSLSFIENGRGGGQPALAQGSGSAVLAQLEQTLAEAQQLLEKA